MSANRWRVVTLPFLVATLASPVLVNCGAMKNIPGAGALGDLDPRCPVDTASIDAIAKADWAGSLKLDVKAAGQIKGSLQAALNLQKLSAEIDGELKVACTNLAKDLGGSVGDAKDAPAACQAAIKAMGDLKGQIGASATFALDITAPKCSASMNAMAECSGKCDVEATGGKAEVKCEGGEISGECSAKCEGSCDVSAGAKCEGSCDGTCDAQMSGTCEGKCEGKCDGKAVGKDGKCAGKCDGKCDGQVKGECKGTCKGGCELKAGGSCSGECTGKCSAEFKAPKCSGTITPPKVSADCKASCDAEVSGKLECTPAGVKIVVKGAANADAAAKYQAAIEKNLPAILKVAIGMKDRLEGVAKAGEQVIAGAKAAVEVAGKGDKKIALKLGACVAMPFKGAIDAVASVKANVNVSVDIKASASASGSAGAKAGGLSRASRSASHSCVR